jgi:hypothetical protein
MLLHNFPRGIRGFNEQGVASDTDTLTRQPLWMIAQAGRAEIATTSIIQWAIPSIIVTYGLPRMRRGGIN